MFNKLSNLFSKPQKSNPVNEAAEASASENNSDTWDSLKEVEFQRRQAKEGLDYLSPESKSNLSAELAAIPSAVDLRGKEKVMDSLSDKHSRRILAAMSGRGFADYQNCQPDDLATFLEIYPTPVEFQASENQFLDSIQAANPPEKYIEYVQAMSNFKSQIYGQRQTAFEDTLYNDRPIRITSE